MEPASLLTTEILAVGAAFLSAVATAFAAVATFRGPSQAARLANELRKQSETESEKQRLKMWVFTSIMQERATINAPDSVRALNLIDVVFLDSREVREAWAELLIGLDRYQEIGTALIDEKIRRLLIEMAKDLQVADSLRLDDIGRIYVPNSMAEENEIAARHRALTLEELRGGHRSKSNRENEQKLLEQWPPKPIKKTD